MERFSIEVSPRKVPAGSEATMPPAATPSDLTNCNCAPAVRPDGAIMRKAERNPEIRRPQNISPLSDA